MIVMPRQIKSRLPVRFPNQEPVSTKSERLTNLYHSEMSKGSALIFLGSAWHGGGHNSITNSQRTMYSLFFIRGTMRTEENQFLATPRSVALGMSPKMLELLGYKKPSPPLGTVNNMNPMNDLDAIWQAAAA